MAAHDRDTPSELIERLTHHVSAFGFGGASMDEHERLTSEALDCAKHGLIDEARHRLRLRDRPKWGHEANCHRQYNAAVAETRAARAAQ